MDVIGRYGLEFQRTRREICNNLRLGSYRPAWPYADKIICIETSKVCGIRMYLRLDAFGIKCEYDLLYPGPLSSAAAFSLLGSESSSHKQEGDNE